MPNGVINPRGRSELDMAVRNMTPAEKFDFAGKKGRKKKKPKKNVAVTKISFVIKTLAATNPIEPFKGKSLKWITQNQPGVIKVLLRNSTLRIEKSLRSTLAKISNKSRP